MATFQWKDVLAPFRNTPVATTTNSTNDVDTEYKYKTYTPVQPPIEQIPNIEHWRKLAKEAYAKKYAEELQGIMLTGKTGVVVEYRPDRFYDGYSYQRPTGGYQWVQDPYEVYSKEGDKAIEVFDKLTLLPLPESIEAVRKELNSIDEETEKTQTASL